MLYTISKLQGNSLGVGKIHVEDIIQMCDKNIGNKYLTPNKNLKVLVQNKKLYFVMK